MLHAVPGGCTLIRFFSLGKIIFYEDMLVVADSGNNRIIVLTPEGLIKVTVVVMILFICSTPC
jgi:hypothetical protein